MNAYANQMNQYKNSQILNASPEQILIMLYDGAIRFTRQAVLGIEEDRPSLKLEGVSRAMAIIAEFSNTLDREAGGEIADNLDGLYYFMMNELAEARTQNSVTKLRAVEHILLDLREGFVGAIEVNRSATQPPPVAGDASEAKRVAVSF